MNSVFKMVLASIARINNLLKGRRYLKIININDDPHEVYHFILHNGGKVSLYCTETVYEMVFDSAWVKNVKHRAYSVKGVCDECVPQELAARLTQGFYIGQLLPSYASSVDQKKAASQAFIAMIADQIKSQR